jgi:ABC-type uncharacterized transport system involved in gliding motility auxiliary subunit
MGYALEGKFTSAYPNGEPGSDPNTSAPAPSLKESPDKVRLLVMASSGMINDQQLPIQYAPVYRSNILFAINAVDWLIHDDSLMALRSKGMGSRPLTVLYDGKVRNLVWGQVLGLPLLLVAIGILQWRRRASRRASAAL